MLDVLHKRQGGQCNLAATLRLPSAEIPVQANEPLLNIDISVAVYKLSMSTLA
jgi:hypothetical protein